MFGPMETIGRRRGPHPGQVTGEPGVAPRAFSQRTQQRPVHGVAHVVGLRTAWRNGLCTSQFINWVLHWAVHLVAHEVHSLSCSLHRSFTRRGAWSDNTWFSGSSTGYPVRATLRSQSVYAPAWTIARTLALRLGCPLGSALIYAAPHALTYRLACTAFCRLDPAQGCSVACETSA